MEKSLLKILQKCLHMKSQTCALDVGLSSKKSKILLLIKQQAIFQIKVVMIDMSAFKI